MMDTKVAREKVLQAVERFAPLTDELVEAIDELRADSLFICWIVASVSFGMWQGSWWAGAFMFGALPLLDPRSS